MPRVSLFVALSLALVGCSAASTPIPSQSPAQTALMAPSASPSTAQSASPSVGTIVSPSRRTLGHRTDPDRRHQGLDARGGHRGWRCRWLDRRGRLANPVTHSCWISPARPSLTQRRPRTWRCRSGSLERSCSPGSSSCLRPGEPGNVDTYTFDATLSGDELSLRCVDSTEQGTAEDKAMHRRFTIAFYCSAPFRRQP